MKTNDLESIKEAFTTGPDITAQHGDSGGILQVAAIGGSIEILSILLEHGADPNAPGDRYGIPLQAWAVRYAALGMPRRLQELQLLLNRGARVNALGGEYNHVLIAAAYALPRTA